VSTLPLIDQKSKKPALKHLRKQFCMSLIEVEGEELYISDEDFDSDFGDIGLCEQPRGDDIPMEISSRKNFIGLSSPSPFVRHGFGRVSTASTSSKSVPESENYNCVEEMASASEDGHGRNKTTTVKHCITKYNSSSLSSTKSIVVYADEAASSNVAEKNKVEIIHSTEQPAASKILCSINNNLTKKVTLNREYSVPSVEPVKSSGSDGGAIYHSYYVYPRTRGSAAHSPNLLWHQLNINKKSDSKNLLEQQRAKSLSPEPTSKRPLVVKDYTTKEAVPESWRLIKMTMEAKESDITKEEPEPEKTGPNFKITTKPLLSRDKVDKALETLRKSSVGTASPKLRSISKIRVNRSESMASPKSAFSIKSPIIEPASGPASLPPPIIKRPPEEAVESEASSPSRSYNYKDTPQFRYSVVVAIDFGTTYSGYAYSFTHDPENIQIMRKWEGMCAAKNAV
jgi:hypothetical protein